MHGAFDDEDGGGRPESRITSSMTKAEVRTSVEKERMASTAKPSTNSRDCAFLH